MASINSIPSLPTKKKGHKNANRPTFIPPAVQPGQKSESLDRRIRNIEALDNGIFLGNVLASYLALPGLVGFWPMSSVQRSTGNAYDLSGQGRTLTYTGNPTYSYYNGLVPYIDLDGTGDYLTRTDETDLDVLGTETIFTSGAAGLTLGGWFWVDTFGSVTRLLSKENNSTQLSYVIYSGISGGVTFAISNTGSAFAGSVSSSVAITTGQWHFIAGRFIPSTETAIFVNSTETNNTTSIPASIFNSTSAFSVGSLSGGGNTLDGRAALCFLCANALGDGLISSLYQQSRVLFNV